MTNEIFDQKLTLSLQRLEALWKQADALPKLPGKMWRQLEESPGQPQELLKETLEELSDSLEELQVAVEEIHQQSEELAQRRNAVELERQRYQELFESAPDGYLLTTAEGTIREANWMAEKLLDISKQHLIGKPLVVFIGAEEHRSFYSQLSQLQKGESIKNWQVQIQPRHGGSFTTSFAVTPIQDCQNQVVELRWRFSELTLAYEEEQESNGEFFTKHSKESVTKLSHYPIPSSPNPLTSSPTSSTRQESVSVATRQEQDLFRAMFERATVGIALLDSQGCIIKTNQTLQEMLGCREETLQTILPEMMNLDKSGADLTQFQELIAGQCRSYQLEKRILGQDTSVQWGRLTFSLVPGAGDEPAFVTCIVEDITELRQREQAQGQLVQQLEASFVQQYPTSAQLDTQSQQRAISVERLGKVLNDILSSSPNSFFICDRAGKYIYANQAAAEALGFAQSDFIGKTWRELGFSREIMERVDAQREAVLKTGEALTDEVSFPILDSIRDYEYTISPISESDRSPEAVVITVKDITEQKRAVAAATQTLAKEAEFSELHSDLTCVVSHELRNPLNTIIGCTQLIESYSQQWPEEKRHSYLKQIRVNVKRIHQLLDDLLLIRKAQTGKLGLAPALVDITEFCRDLIEELQQGEGSKHKITLNSQPQRSGIWDKKLLRRTLINLLLNAIKYSPEGSEVKLSVICQGEKAIFCIQDSGSGIPQEDQQLLLKAFHQGSNIRPVADSSLGLSIVKQCVDLHKGQISVESEVGIGTTITLTLPLAQRGRKK
jgi:PAS domain S-box-containing protein